MYRQVLVDEQDRDMQCILWRDKPDQPVKIYRLRTVTYGTSSASFLAIRSMRQLAVNEAHKYTAGSYHVLHNFYVDNLMTGANTIQELTNIKEEVSKLLLEGHFPLRKWCSNADEVLADLDACEVEPLLRVNDGDVIRLLGLLWNPFSDTFSFSCFDKTMKHKFITKRIVLSQITSFYNPLGFISPVIVSGKLFLRHLWTKGVDWDESLPQELDWRWKEFLDQLQYLQTLKIPRLSVMPGFKIQLHGLSDASMRAYGACIYYRCECPSGDVQTYFVCAKSRIAPILCESLARLELCGALLLVELVQRVKSAVNINFDSTYLWSDSTIMLSWITSVANQWSIFVSYRISKIQKLSSKESWHHVPSQENPADIISRGSLPKEFLKNQRWFAGPPFLRLEPSRWPRLHLTSTVECPEKKRLAFSFISKKEMDICDLTTRCKFSNSFYRLIIVFCYIRRWFRKKEDRIGRITTAEINASVTSIVRNIQAVHFQGEIDTLASGKCLKDSSFIRLSVFLDDSNILRVGGRLRNSTLPYDSRHQMLLHSSHPVVNSMTMYYHVMYLHAGNQTVLNILRRRFWIVNGPRTVSSTLRKCLICFRFQPLLATQVMGDLPPERLTPARPFAITGIDYCGPVYLTQRIRGRPPTKAYVAVFVCYVAKAVHLELVPDLSTEAFLSALRRFLSRRGNCLKIFSDNGSNFIGAKNELEKICQSALKGLKSDAVQQFCQKSGISWSLLPPRAPHFGGLWEAAVKVAKKHMQKIIASEGNIAYTYDEMTTLLCQVEAVMNSRPMSPMSNDPNDEEALTPAHFLVRGPLTDLPQPLLSSKINRLTHYQRIQYMRDTFWKRWRQDYLHLLQSRNKWTTDSPNIKIGDLVLIHDDNLPPLKRKMGRIHEVYHGRDGKVRVVSVRISGSVIRRPISKVAVLPINDELNASC